MLLDKAKQEEQAALLRGYTSEYSAFTKQCKAMVEARRARSPVQVELTTALIESFEQYEMETLEAGKPLTLAGYMLAGGFNSSETFYKIMNGEYDYVVDEYRILHDLPQEATQHVDEDGVIIPLIPWSNILQNARLKIQQQLEENCYSNQRGVNPAGSIFGLKAQHGWKEDATAPHTVNNTLVIADGEQARKALKSLE